MKRAKAQVTGSALLQFYKFANDIQDVYAAEDLLYGVLGNQFCLI